MVKGAYLADGDAAEAVIGRELADAPAPGRRQEARAHDQRRRRQPRRRAVPRQRHLRLGLDRASTATSFSCRSRFARRTVYRLPEDAATQIGVVLQAAPGSDSSDARAIRAAVAGQRAVAVRPWQEIQPEVASYIRLDQGSNWIFQALLVMLVLFTIFNTVLMSVLERQREFAMLLALGTRPADLRWQVFLETVIPGACSAARSDWSDRGRAQPRASCRCAASTSGPSTRTAMTISGFAIDPVLHARVSVGMLGGDDWRRPRGDPEPRPHSDATGDAAADGRLAAVTHR